MADKRYIDADKLTFSRVRIIHSDGTIGGWHAVVMSSVIKDAPAADVVEVVRCKDCAWSRMIVVNGKPEYYCQCWNPGNVIHVNAHGFCVWGERNEQT